MVDPDGNVWTGTEDGSIFRITPDGAVVERIANTGGRPLGLEWWDGRVVIADAHLGLLALTPETGDFESLVVEVEDTPMVFCNNAAIATNGDIWFSESSTRYPIEEWKSDLVQATRTGRLMCRRADGSVEIHLTGLEFANGVALAADESFVAVAETGGRTVQRLWLAGPKAGTQDLLCQDLPGYPDNIARGSDGLIWVTIASPLDPVVEFLRTKAPMWLRKAATRLPAALQPAPKRTVRAQAYDDAGALVHDIDVDAAAYHMATGVREHEGTLWFGSLHEPAVACVEL